MILPSTSANSSSAAIRNRIRNTISGWVLDEQNAPETERYARRLDEQKERVAILPSTSAGLNAFKLLSAFHAAMRRRS